MFGQQFSGNRVGRRVSALAATIGLVAAVLGVVASSPPAHAQTGFPLTCESGALFNNDGFGNLYSLTNSSNPTNTQLGDFTPGVNTPAVNALGVAENATTVYAAQLTTGAGATTMTVFRMNGANGAVSTTTVPGIASSTFVMGAVNPSNGIYYYAAYGNIPTGGPRILRILAYNPATNTGLGEVARIQVDPSGTSTVDGDFAFDHAGNLYVLVGRRTVGAISTVLGVQADDLPSTAPSGPPPTIPAANIDILARITTPTGAYFNGIAFGADGNLYAQSTDASFTPARATLWTINPNDGDILASNIQTFPAGFPPGTAAPNDLASCSFPGTLTVKKDLPQGRANPNDQFTMTITGGGMDPVTGTTTSTGPATGVQDGHAGPTIGLPTTTYTISETLDPDSPNTTPHAYDSQPPTCVDTTNNNADVPVTANGGGSFSLDFPSPSGLAGAAVVCTFTNTPATPSLTLRKDLAGSGRLDPADQFTMQILDPNNNPVGSGNPTTQGAGADVAPNTGIQTVAAATAGGTYHLSESMAAGSVSALTDYQHVIECTDLNHVQTGLPNHTFTAAQQPIQVTPQPGSSIECVMTNARHEPVLGLSKVFGTHRVRPGDQFRVAIVGPGGEVTPEPEHDPTTAGTGSDVTDGTGTTGFVPVTTGNTYSLTEAPVGATDAALYTSTVTCVDENGLTTGLPDNTPLSANPTVTPVDGSWIDCTITNTGVSPRIQLSKALGGPRANAGDQFTMQIRNANGNVVGATAHATTTGTGDVVDQGTGVTLLDPATAGSPHFLDEIPAAGTPTNLSQYTSSLTCTDANGIQTDLPADETLAGALELTPQLGADISCTITNSPAPADLTLNKALGSARVNAGDQFTMQILDNGTVVGTTANATTTGTGSRVTPGTGVTALSPATVGTSHTLTELASGTTSLADYTKKRIACVDNSGVQTTGLPQGTFTGSATVTPVDGASISCTVTNTPPPPPTKPRIRTATSDRSVTTGRPFRDRIHVAGLRPHQRVAATIALYGPFNSRASATCRPNSRILSRNVRVRNGLNRTTRVRVHQPGVYTWRASIPATAANHAATHRCGQAAETTVVFKPPYPAPRIPGGFSGTTTAARSSDLARRAPTVVRMPAIGLNATVISERVVRGTMVLPPFRQVGWLRKSDRFGDKIGTAVLGGHVSDRHDRPGALFRLKNARRGQLVTVTSAGKTFTYKVTGKTIFSRQKKIPTRFFTTKGRPRLALVSCVHKVVFPNGRFHYTRTIVVVANQIRP